MDVIWWPKPEAGDLVWYHFPHLPKVEPGPKPRPGLVFEVTERKPHFRVTVVYGTNQKTASLRRGEFLIRKDSSAAFKVSGLSFETKLSFADMIELDYSDTWFKVPPHAPCGQTPKMGILHAVYAKAAQSAYGAVCL